MSGIFRTQKPAISGAKDPESLFLSLNARSSQIKNLWSHQADILRKYHSKQMATENLALELPTGSGKTLVALLIAEYRRRNNKERCLYLCPTRQLAQQVGAQANSYGIEAQVFVGPAKDYPQSEFYAYTRSEIIAVSTISSVFNVRPRLNDANLIIIDDAHAAEQYIAKLWSIEIDSEEHSDLYCALLDILEGPLDSNVVRKLKEHDSASAIYGDVELIPGINFRERLQQIHDVCEAHIQEGPLQYSWGMIRDALAACNLFVSSSSILIRPVIPPTMTHMPFATANQRIFMSATLGASGELERITGLKKIERVPVPEAYEQQGVGRRLFVMPELSLNRKQSREVMAASATEVDRALMIIPAKQQFGQFSDLFRSAGLTVMTAKDIEDDLQEFTESEGVVLLLTNRYDGIDLPDDSCRLLFMHGLPAFVNLQEWFLLARLGAISVLRDRLVTRITQGIGRCTRSHGDYAIVFITGEQLVEFLQKSCNTSLMHPEIQAELEFGIHNSQKRDKEQFEELQRAFLDRSPEWGTAEKEIIGSRESKSKEQDPVATKLFENVANEVEYVYRLWSMDTLTALECARMIADHLGGPFAKSYRGFWHYLAGDAALMEYEAKHDPQMLIVAKEQFSKAAKCSPTVRWLSSLSQLKLPDGNKVDANQKQTLSIATEGVCKTLTSLGIVGPRFEERMRELADNVTSSDHSRVQKGLKFLGEVLGFDSFIPEGNNTPDCIWRIEQELCFVFETKVESKSSEPIPAKDLKQGNSHRLWVKEHVIDIGASPIVPILITTQSRMDEGNRAFSETLMYMPLTKLLELATKTHTTLRSIRASTATTNDSDWREFVSERLGQARLQPEQLMLDYFSELIKDLR